MRKFLLLLPLAFIGLLLDAQLAHRDNTIQNKLIERSVVVQQNQPVLRPGRNQRSGRALSPILNSHRIGSAGNLLTIIDAGCHMIDVNDSLNTVTFIHRNDPTGAPGTNIAQYRFDISKDRGFTWTNNIGPITNDPLINNIDVNGRFPQAVIYNPAGNTIADSAFLVYNGTYHNVPPGAASGTWQGHMVGDGHLSGDVSSFSVSYEQLNGGEVAVSNSLVQGAPGVFWNINQDYTGTFAAGDPAITEGILIEKGVWNATGDSVNWTSTIIPQLFAEGLQGTTQASYATSFNIAFDPSGQYGWISCLGDVDASIDSVYQPIFWKSVDSGATWTGPISVDLEAIPGLVATLNPLLLDNTTPASLNPTTTFDSDLTVDVNGNPHFLTLIGSGEDYAIQAAGYGVWDITYSSAGAGCGWQGFKLADAFTLRGDMTSDNPAFTEDNRPLISRSPDGHKIFFFWNETDINFVGSTENSVPNLFGRAIDIVDATITPLYNFTEGDSLWGGETEDSLGGEFGGSIYPTVSPTCLVNGNIYNIPLVLTQVDYLNFVPGQLGSSENPAAFWYIDNINVPASDFSASLDQAPPVITPIGGDTVWVPTNTAYTELGATAIDCFDGVVTYTTSGSVDSSAPNIYYIYYIASDASGNTDTTVRTVVVGAAPVANFNWSFPNVNFPNRPQFADQSANNPVQWAWTFGDGGTSAQQNPIHAFGANGTFEVCLIATNPFGSSIKVCKDVIITGYTGIEEVDFAQQLSMFPNPSNGKVQITMKGETLPEVTVTVHNVLGETIIAPTKYKAGTSRIEMDLSTVSSGLYLVKIQSNAGTAIKHLTISHK